MLIYILKMSQYYNSINVNSINIYDNYNKVGQLYPENGEIKITGFSGGGSISGLTGSTGINVDLSNPDLAIISNTGAVGLTGSNGIVILEY